MREKKSLGNQTQEQQLPWRHDLLLGMTDRGTPKGVRSGQSSSKFIKFCSSGLTTHGLAAHGLAAPHLCYFRAIRLGLYLKLQAILQNWATENAVPTVHLQAVPGKYYTYIRYIMYKPIIRTMIAISPLHGIIT